jgi:hypothetical protein
MAITQIRGQSQVLDYTVNKVKLEQDFLAGADWNITNGANNATITGVKDPVNPQDVATKAYADALAQGLKPQIAVQAATTTNLSVTPSGAGVGKTLTATSTGALILDGYTVIANDRVLIKDQTLSVNNGIYIVTSTGSAGTAFILTRATDFDGSPATEVVSGAYVFVESGTNNGNTGWVLKTTGVITIDVTGQTWVQFSGEGRYVAGDGIDFTGNIISVDVTDIIDTNYGLTENSNNIQVNLDVLGGLSFDGTSHGIKISADGIKDSMIDWGTSTGQVDASDIPFSDPGNDYSATNVSAALEEVMNAVQAIDSSVSMDDAYNNGSIVNVDNTNVDFQLTDTKSFKVTSDSGVTNVFDVTAALTGDTVSVVGTLNQSGGAFNLNGNATSTIGTTNATLNIQTTSSGLIAINSAGGLTFNDQYTSTGIALSQTGVTGLVGFTATSIVASLNELKSSIGGTPVEAELPTVVHNSTTVTLAHSPTGAKAKVYLNGIRQAPGTLNDYTIATNIITFNFQLKTHDVVLVDYSY